jgi:glucose-1-phosphate cytidylyltransferase
MKVVLFCGGYGMRMRGWNGEGLPKPLQLVGDLPLVVHVMGHYARFGHKDFVLCLGYAADQVRAAVAEAVAHCPHAQHWNIEYVDTGLKSSIGERLWQVRQLLADQPMFFANYTDVLSDVSLDSMVARMNASPDAVAMMLAVRPQASFHVIDVREDDTVIGFRRIVDLPLLENGGYMILRQSIFDHLGDGRDLIDVIGELAPFNEVIAYRHDGFWMPADTFKERALLHEMYESGNAPWIRTLAAAS